jgi:putative membrane protein
MARAPEVFHLDPAPDATVRRSDVEVVESQDAFAPQETLSEQQALKRTGMSGWWKLFWLSLIGFITLAATVAAYDFVVGLLTKYPPLGYFAVALAGLLVLALIVVVFRELMALWRLGSAEKMRKAADVAFGSVEPAPARDFVRQISDFYKSDPTTARGRAALASHAGEIIDAPNLILLAERELLKDKDDQARRAIAAASSKVAMVTTISPRAWVDIGFVLAQAFMLISRIATIYSGRPGGLAVWRLSARVATHLAITGGIAVAHDAIGQVLGAGLVARLSSKLGEGVLNGVLTARVGLSAIAVCRPMVFRAYDPPSLSEVAGSLLSQRGEAAKSAQ